MPNRPFALVARADTNPFVCVRCQRDPQLIDLGADPIGAFGVVYFCTICFAELCTLANMIGQDQLLAERSAFQTQIASLVEETRRLRQPDPDANPWSAPLKKELLDGIRDLLDTAA